jgi:predicted DsbA family dithiol-disulfide isomerase
MTMTNSLTISCSYDLICPWCWIAKVNLERALIRLKEYRPELRVKIEWHGVQLIPEVPEQGWSFAEFYERRLGNKQAVALRQRQVNQAAAQAGLEINFDKITVFPNTAMAHAVLNYAQRFRSAETFEKLLDRLYLGYFILGENLGDPQTIFKLAHDVGIARAVLESWLANPESVQTKHSPRVSGVPNYVFGGTFAVSGVQSPEKYLSIMSTILQTRIKDVCVEQT